MAVAYHEKALKIAKEYAEAIDQTGALRRAFFNSRSTERGLCQGKEIELVSQLLLKHDPKEGSNRAFREKVSDDLRHFFLSYTSLMNDYIYKKLLKHTALNQKALLDSNLTIYQESISDINFDCLFTGDSGDSKETRNDAELRIYDTLAEFFLQRSRIFLDEDSLTQAGKAYCASARWNNLAQATLNWSSFLLTSPTDFRNSTKLAFWERFDQVFKDRHEALRDLRSANTSLSDNCPP